MGYKNKPIPAGAKLEDVFKHTSGVYRHVARLFFDGFSGTTKDLVEQTNVSITSVWTAVKAFREAGLIYVSAWVKADNISPTLIAIYKAGNQPDAARPIPKDPTQSERNKKHRRAVRDRLLHEGDKYNWQGIAEALVPRRTPEEVAEINKLYVQWITESNHG